MVNIKLRLDCWPIIWEVICNVPSSRLMRLPGTHNSKNGRWIEVRTILIALALDGRAHFLVRQAYSLHTEAISYLDN
jgi:hypothetical protein